MERNLDPLVLDLNDYNLDVKAPSPKKPIIFNEQGGRFSCRGSSSLPPLCAYGSLSNPPFSQFSINATGESYTFCGARARVGGTCSIDYSNDILATMRAGASPIGQNVSSVSEVRHNV